MRSLSCRSQRVGLRSGLAVTFALLTAAAQAETIRTDPLETSVLPGGSGLILMLLEDSATPIAGYTLDISFVPRVGATGAVTADVSATNFFDSRNIITAGGEMRDPIFSSISPSGGGGVVVTTITADGDGVLATASINDVLAQVAVKASVDAQGTFDIVLESGTALSDSSGSAIPFTTELGWISVVPVPATVMPALMGAGMIARRRRSWWKLTCP